MAWTYSDWTTMTGTAQVTELGLHIKEVSDRITEDYSTGVGQSKSTGTLERYLESLKSDFRRLGGVMARANGRSRVNRIDFINPARGAN